MRKRSGCIIILAVIASLLASGWFYYKWKYPYGHSHCCIKAMLMAFLSYADDHDGEYPTGESSPEASLSLLYRDKYIPDPYILRGMTVPHETARRILEEGQLLGPDTCGWHYVEGLTRADDPNIAVLWPKVALGHNGQRTKDGGREVLFVGADLRWITGDQWPAFLEEQKELLAQRNKKDTKKPIE